MTTTHILGDNVPRKSNFDPDLAKKLTKYYEEHPEELGNKPNATLIKTETTKQSVDKYILMPESKTYMLGVNDLQEACVKENNQKHPKFNLPDGRVVYRPLTVKENCLARLEQYNTQKNSDGSQRTLEQRIEFMLEWNDSCCGIAFPAKKLKSSKFKLILQSPELISLPTNFEGGFYPIDYDQLPYTRELDSKGAEYKEKLTPAEIDTHEGWLTLFENDANVLRDYRQVIEEAVTLMGYYINTPQTFMTFWLTDRVRKEDQLERLMMGPLILDSMVKGNSLLPPGQFLRHKP